MFILIEDVTFNDVILLITWGVNPNADTLSNMSCYSVKQFWILSLSRTSQCSPLPEHPGVFYRHNVPSLYVASRCHSPEQDVESRKVMRHNEQWRIWMGWRGIPLVDSPVKYHDSFAMEFCWSELLVSLSTIYRNFVKSDEKDLIKVFCNEVSCSRFGNSDMERHMNEMAFKWNTTARVVTRFLNSSSNTNFATINQKRASVYFRN